MFKVGDILENPVAPGYKYIVTHVHNDRVLVRYMNAPCEGTINDYSYNFFLVSGHLTALDILGLAIGNPDGFISKDILKEIVKGGPKDV